MIAQDEVFVDALLAEDFHADMAKVMFNTDDITPDQRIRGKNGTFTWVFGGGAKSVVNSARREGAILDFAVADAMIRNLNRRFVKSFRWHMAARHEANRHAVKIHLPWGHERILIGEKKTPNTVLNTKVQGRAAVGLKEAVFACANAGILKYVAALVHDEIVLASVPDGEVEEVKETFRQAMIEGMQEVCSVPVKVDAESGKMWGN